MSISVTGSVLHTVYKAYEKRLLKEIKEGPIPQHVAIIMDGNRRFAESMGMSKTEGHLMGKSRLERVLEWGQELGMKMLTVYAFSTENTSRSEEEVASLMDLFEKNFRIAADDERVHKNKVRVRAIGDIQSLPERVQQAISYCEEATKDYDGFHLNLAVAYGGREELTTAIRAIASDVRDNELEPDEINEDTVSKYLYTKGMPDPDLVLRTSGEVRISNFLLWQLAYSELYFSDVYWPEFRKVDFLRAVRSYQQRQRRYGK